MKKPWLTLLALLITGSIRTMAWAAPGPVDEDRSELQELLLKPEISDVDLNVLYFRTLDDPRKLVRDLAALWRSSQNSRQRLLQARSGWMIAKFSSPAFGEEVNLDFLEVIEESIALVEQDKLAVPLSELYFYRADSVMDRSLSRGTEQPSPLLDLAEKVEGRAERTLLLAKIASSASDRGDIDHQLARLLNVIRQELDPNQPRMPGVAIQTLTFLRDSLQRMGQKSEAESIDRILTQQCFLHRMRSFCALRDYEEGISLIRQETRASAEASKALFKRALELSLEIDDKEYIANGYYGLSLACSKTEVFDEAMRYGYLAYESYVKLGKMVWAASTLKNLASALLVQKKPEEALRVAQTALAICPPEYSIDIMKIYEKIAAIYAALGRYQEAFHYSQLYIQKTAQIKAEDADRKYMELRNETLTTQNEMQQARIQLLNKFRIVSFLAAGLSMFLCGALLILWRQGTVIRMSRQKMKQVLDHIDEGIAVLDKKLNIEPGYSTYLGKLFERDGASLDGEPFLNLVFQKNAVASNEFNMTRGTLLTCIGEHAMSWEVNKDHLPHEVTNGDRLLALHWQPLYSDAKLISRYLVSVRDITELRGIQRRAALESERVQHLQDVLEEVLRGKVDLIRQTVGEIHSDLPTLKEKFGDDAEINFVMRRLHTWKGGTRALGLKRLAEVLHEMETKVLSAQSASAPEIPWELLFQWLEHYQHILSNFTGSDVTRGSSVEDLYSYAGLYAREVQQRLAGNGAACAGVWILDRVLHWKPEVLPRLHDMLIHAISNSLDHGFIQPMRRYERVPAALIRIQAEPAGDKVIIQVTDNGYGLDWSALRQKAEKLGFVLEEGQSLSQVLFLDGISTAEAVSATSGRGVGLSAIRSMCLDLAGTIEIKDAVGGGTTLRMEFPLGSVAEDYDLPATAS